MTNYITKDMKAEEVNLTSQEWDHLQRIIASKPIDDQLKIDFPLSYDKEKWGVAHYEEVNGKFSFAVGFPHDMQLEMPCYFVRGRILEKENLTRYQYSLGKISTGETSYWTHDFHSVPFDDKEVYFVEIVRFDRYGSFPYHAEIQEKYENDVNYEIPVGVHSEIYHRYQCQNLELSDLCTELFRTPEARMKACKFDFLGEITSCFGRQAYQKKRWALKHRNPSMIQE